MFGFGGAAEKRPKIPTLRTTPFILGPSLGQMTKNTLVSDLGLLNTV